MPTLEDIRQQLLPYVQACVQKAAEPVFKLASGRMSDFYIDGRQVTLTGQPLRLLAEAVLAVTADDNITAAGGMAVGADPITGAVLAVAAERGLNLKGFLCRKQAKEHGTGKRVEGPALTAEDRIVLLEDTVTTGGSLLKTVDALREAYGEVSIARVVCLADRREGAAEAMAAAGLPFTPIFTRDDFSLNS
jgi:orotate phosphoribosyltransferase